LRSNLVLFIALAVLGSAGTTAATAQDALAAKSFLMDAYAHYGKNGKGIDWSKPEGKQFFHPSLISMMQADVKDGGADNSSIAGEIEPLCICQDWSRISDLKIDVKVESPRIATADVSFGLADARHPDGNDSRQLKISLLIENGQWRISNVVSYPRRGLPFNLRAQVQKEIEVYRKAAKAESDE
jgi:hypothetical protein